MQMTCDDQVNFRIVSLGQSSVGHPTRGNPILPLPALARNIHHKLISFAVSEEKGKDQRDYTRVLPSLKRRR